MSGTERGTGVIAVAGEALVDMVPTGAPGEFAAMPGGSPTNVAVGLVRLDVPVRMLARIGTGTLGDRVRNFLRDNAIGLDHAIQGSEPTSLALLDLDADGVARYDFRIDGTADWQWTDAELGPALDGDVAALHTGSLAMTQRPGADALLRLVERARATATISYDPNMRPQLMIHDDARARVETMLGLADVLKVSSEDLAWLYPDRAPEDVLTDWACRGPALVVVTLGGEGALAATAEDPRPIRRPGVPIELVDTVGAGDAFAGGLLAGLHRRDLLGAHRRKALRALESAELIAIVDEAMLVAALTCGRRGADPPTTREVRAAQL
ncbi:carbohydrate kinase [Nocardia sp. NEAU-G5]|uniref:Carbohydrate kinase n=1 Tax=Nocardia albiluteola TaxID=2842303 RepID=A0ABS6AX50_9NOCA|nr:carbohydrate kinase [Nocardia albiluteola]MBU3062645.1 carbohydrate kinase [Nocardia albiluteola]MBU3065521.1 carbohydrate kinase [Nocardia albiluteola]